MTPLIAREARLAQELGHFTPRGNGLLGVVAAAYNYDRKEAARLFDASLKENVGSDAEARWSYATFFLAPAGRFDEALRLLELVIGGDPLNTTWRGATAQYLNMAGRHELALQRTAEIMDLDSKYWVAYLYAAEAYAALGRWPEARAAAETAFGFAPWSPRAHGLLAAALTNTGDRLRADQLTAAMASSPQPHWGPQGLVLYSLLLGDIDAAARWYELSIEQRDAWVMIQANGWLTRELRASTHWPRLATMMNPSARLSLSTVTVD